LLGKHELRLGHAELALQHYLEAHRLLGASIDAVPRKHYLRTMFETGVAYLRWGETQNCVENYHPDSCIFPIKGRGVHEAREGSSHAIHYFNEVLKNAAPNSTIALRSRWLLTIAHMTLGDHSLLPGREHVLDQKLFASNEPFPRFEQIASRVGLDSWDLAGGAIAEDQTLHFAPDHSIEERAKAVANIIKASCGEASMMARCTGKTQLHNLEPEDMRALTLPTTEATDILLVGKH